jgi:hypothetical protein
MLAPTTSEYGAVGTFVSAEPIEEPLPQLGFHYSVALPLSVGMGVHYSDHGVLGSSFELEPRRGRRVSDQS